jgi:hypothetical protein
VLVAQHSAGLLDARIRHDTVGVEERLAAILRAVRVNQLVALRRAESQLRGQLGLEVMWSEARKRRTSPRSRAWFSRLSRNMRSRVQAMPMPM